MILRDSLQSLAGEGVNSLQPLLALVELNGRYVRPGQPWRRSWRRHRQCCFWLHRERYPLALPTSDQSLQLSASIKHTVLSTSPLTTALASLNASKLLELCKRISFEIQHLMGSQIPGRARMSTSRLLYLRSCRRHTPNRSLE